MAVIKNFPPIKQSREINEWQKKEDLKPIPLKVLEDALKDKTSENLKFSQEDLISILDLILPVGEITRSPDTPKGKYEYNLPNYEDMGLASILGSIATSKGKKVKKLGTKILKKFTTARGSKYNWHVDNRTQRIWRSPKGHHDKSTGIQPDAPGFFIKPNDAYKLNPLANPKTSTQLLPPITREGKHIAKVRNTDTGEIVSEVEILAKPEKGLLPLEVFYPVSPKGYPNVDEKIGVHVGSKIISID